MRVRDERTATETSDADVLTLGGMRCPPPPTFVRGLIALLINPLSHVEAGRNIDGLF